jgi:hypothetical protein
MRTSPFFSGAERYTNVPHQVVSEIKAKLLSFQEIASQTRDYITNIEITSQTKQTKKKKKKKT